nr:Chain a, synthetic peptide (polymer) [synthetic construct]4X6Z_e Chain e, synthetic peptide (polymer) [synthetic construct]
RRRPRPPYLPRFG